MAIPTYLSSNFQVMCQACDDGNLGLLEVTKTSDNTIAYVLVIRSTGDDGMVNIIPMAEFFINPEDAMNLYKVPDEQNAPTTETQQ